MLRRSHPLCLPTLTQVRHHIGCMFAVQQRHDFCYSSHNDIFMSGPLVQVLSDEYCERGIRGR